MTQWASQVLSSKEFACGTETKEMQLQSLGQEDPLEEVTANPPQCSRQENPMNREAWEVTVCGVTKSQTQLSTHTTRPEFLDSGGSLLKAWGLIPGRGTKIPQARQCNQKINK